MRFLMKIGNIIFAVFALCCAENQAVAGLIVPMHLTIINNTQRTFNVTQAMNLNPIGPIVERNGGSAQWILYAKGNQLTTIGIYYTAASIIFSCSTPDGLNGAFALNPLIYKGDTVTITVTEGTDPGGYFSTYPVCSCSGSACDIGLAPYSTEITNHNL